MKLYNKPFLCTLILFILGIVVASSQFSVAQDLQNIAENGNLIAFGFANAPPTGRGIAELQVVQQQHTVQGVTNAWYEGVCLYRETVLCQHLDESQYRRPVSEHTNFNQNIAALHSFWYLLTKALPGSEQFYGDLLRDLGYEPNNANDAMDNPGSIGVAAGKAVWEQFVQDGMNVLGDDPDSLFPRTNYSDTTGYTPINTATKLWFINRWQPQMDYYPISRKYSQQSFMVPQTGTADTYGSGIKSIYRSPYSARYRWPFNHPETQLFFEYTEEVIEAQQNLNDYKRMTTEIWDNKLLGPSRLVINAAGQGVPLLKFVDYNFLVNHAGFDSFVSTWAAKKFYDRVRPVSIIRHFYPDRQLQGLGKVGEGLRSITGKEWRSYAYTDAHQEYPSATACFCYSITSALREATGSDSLDTPFSLDFPAGSSFYEPGFYPLNDTTVGPYNTYSEIAAECAQSRIWGGVHFRDAIEEPVTPCTEIGKRAHDRYVRLVNGISKQ
eukprot:gb/GECH01009970.1/.p1 GENE.gb/GECH01009970.1/~~gb/GECH01009970.1/.p1  ORF type:complete len:496 (+),score=119.72 gb/GECH01009970.1/:1-1488(+)